jgi:dephospho-CoA kinase
MKAQNRQKLIIGLVGEKLSGKDTLANFLVEKYGAFHIKFSTLLDEMLYILDLPLSRRNEIDLGLGLRKIFGEEVLYKALCKRSLEAKENISVINGLRMEEQTRMITDMPAKIIYVTADPKIRYERFMNRHEKTDDGKMTYQEFLQQEKERTEIGIPALGKKADFKIVNEGSVEKLYEKVEKIIKELK